MIGKLKGRVDTIDEDSVIIDVGGVGYNVFCNNRTLANLPAPNEAAELVIHTHVREDHIHLFGFTSTYERDWFLLLLTVQGVGVKMAMNVLNIFSPPELAQCIAQKNSKSLTRISGVGNKLAERIISELKDKVTKLPVGTIEGKSTIVNALPPITANEDAISALINLGYNRAQAYAAVSTASVRLGTDDKVDNLIRESLRALAR